MIKIACSLFLLIASAAYAQESVRSIAEIEGSFNHKIGNDFLCYEEHDEPCPTPKPPYIGKKRVYWVPEFLIETVKAPGEYVLVDASSERRKQELIAAAKKSAVQMSGDGSLLDLSSASSHQSMTGGNLQFSEVHVQTFKKALPLGLMCPSPLSNRLTMTKRGTEEYVKKWRKPEAVPWLNVNMGEWGPLYPRAGFMIHSSPMTASVATAIKGLYLMRSHALADASIGLILKADKVQLVPLTSRPRPQCVKIGANLTNYENEYYSKDGRYAWLYWHRHECACM